MCLSMATTELEYSTDLQKAILSRLSIEKPQNMLVVAPELPAELRAIVELQSNISLTHVVFSEFDSFCDGLGRFDYVIVIDTLGDLEKQTAEQLISRLRDIHAKLLWVKVPLDDNTKFGVADAVAQGFRRVETEDGGEQQEQWYEFSLKFYKPVPQWLNAKHWANPARWDKDRW